MTPNAIGLRGVSLASFVLTLLSACTTTTRDSGLSSTEGAYDPLSGRPAFEFEEDRERELFLEMARIETGHGVALDVKHLHSTTGLIACTQDGSTKKCTVRVALKEKGALSPASPLVPALAEDLFNYFDTVRKDLNAEQTILADVACNFLGQDSPPYHTEDVNCTLSDARLPNELIVRGQSAAEISHKLIANLEFRPGRHAIDGAIYCGSDEATQLDQCVVRVVVNGQLTADTKALDEVVAGRITRHLRESARQRFTLANPDKAGDFKPPEHIDAGVRCIVDFKVQDFVCSLKS